MKKKVLGFAFTLVLILSVSLGNETVDAKVQPAIYDLCDSCGHNTWYGFSCDGSGDYVCYYN